MEQTGFCLVPHGLNTPMDVVQQDGFIMPILIFHIITLGSAIVEVYNAFMVITFFAS
jgi:hypothetical protein